MPLRDLELGAHFIMSCRWARDELPGVAILGLSFERYDPATGNYFKTEKGREGIGYDRRHQGFTSAPQLHLPFYKLLPIQPGSYRLSFILLSQPRTSYVTTYAGSQYRGQFPSQSNVKTAEARDWKTVTFEVQAGEVVHLGDLVVYAPERTYPFRIMSIESDIGAARQLLANRPDLSARLTTRPMRLVPL